MYICYLDESGNPSLKDQSKHFVLCGIAIPASEWKAKDVLVTAWKVEHGLEGQEIHTAWMRRRYHEQERIEGFDSLSREERRKQVSATRQLSIASASGKKRRDLIRNHRETESFIHLTYQERLNALENLADMIGTWNEATIFAEAQDKSCYRRCSRLYSGLGRS